MEVFEEIKAQVKKNPALGIVLAVVVIGLFIYLRNQVSAASAATATPTTPATGFAPGGGSYTLVENIHQTPGPTTPPPTPVPPVNPPPRKGHDYVGPNPWMQPPPPGVDPSTWNPYQWQTTIPVANQWPRPSWFVNKYAGGKTYPPHS